MDGEPDWEWEGEDDAAESCTVACSSCGADVYEDAERCPECGDWLRPARGAMVGRPVWWYLVGAVLALAFVLAYVLR